MIEFSSTFEALTGHPPFPWQGRLYERFLVGELPETCLIPTGLGKTSVIAIWLIALANNQSLPRRLVYVVNRRTVVDQTTDEVEKLRDNLKKCPKLKAILEEMCALHLDDKDEEWSPLAISTLRGQHADNQLWSQDPARPAVICGTVDMIGSRLLFSGYRCGFKSKPLQAGFLGQNALLVHDEAHLEPAFQKLVEEICKEQTKNGLDAQPLRVMALSATARNNEKTFELDEEDRKHGVVKQRINAAKELHLHPIHEGKNELVDALTEHALSYQASGKAVLIFAHSVDTVEKVANNIQKELRGLKIKDEGNYVATLTGTMRGLERNQLIEEPVFKRFRPDVKPDEQKIEGTVYLICTSAGEVGVNISAGLSKEMGGAMICDLTTYESMAQRLGRVNRFGACDDTQVHVVHPTEFATDEEAESKPELRYDVSRGRTLRLLQELNGSASPSALDNLDKVRKLAAFSPLPEMLDTSDILFDAWANTTIQELPGRPPVAEYLHGIEEWEPPRTEVAWREDVERITQDYLDQSKHTRDDLLADYPLKPHELLSDRSDRIFDRLKKLYERCEKEFHKTQPEKEFSLQVWVTDEDEKTKSKELREIIEGDKKTFRPHTILLPPSVGGLNNGLFDPSFETADDVSDRWQNEDGKGEYHRRRLMADKKAPEGMRLIRSIQTKPDLADQESSDHNEESADENRSIWNWYVRPNLGDDDGSKATVTEPIPWHQHTDDVVKHATSIANSLLADSPEIQAAMILAARFHDFGKRRKVWQRSIGNPKPNDWYEKSGKVTSKAPEDQWGQLIESTRYRHEFGSLLNLLFPCETDKQAFSSTFSEFEAMNDEQRDIVLHLIAVHHGRGRPHFPIEEVFDPEYRQELSDQLAREVPRRFARLQRKFGRWGLAWLESLFRAADYAASGHPSPVKKAQQEVTA